jgi:hypothetical protein
MGLAAARAGDFALAEMRPARAPIQGRHGQPTRRICIRVPMALPPKLDRPVGA